jgi:hypothetical protein
MPISVDEGVLDGRQLFQRTVRKISDRAKTATDTLRAAGDKTNDKLAADAAATG